MDKLWHAVFGCQNGQTNLLCWTCHGTDNNKKTRIYDIPPGELVNETEKGAQAPR